MKMFSFRSPKWRALLGVGVALALFGAACGDDGSSGSSGAPETTSPDDGSADGPAEPVSGGTATILLLSETGNLDPVRLSGSADMQRAAALYGGLVFLDSLNNEIVPVLAESLEPTGDDFTTWRLTLKPGITFSDGSPMTAAVVKTNWERAANPELRSPSFTTMAAIASMNAVDGLNLDITLASPNASFDHAIARVGANYVASGEAIAAGADLSGTPYGAGPYLLKEWVRDVQMVLTKNPAWKGSDGPYLDEIVLRPLADEEQRVDTFATGQADLFYTSTPASAARAVSERDGSTITQVPVPLGQTYVFNMSRPPFDDIRVRKAFAIGVDWQAMTETTFGAGAEAPYNFTLEGTPLYTPDAALPPYDAAEAQRLIDEYVAEKGIADLTITMVSFQTTQARDRFVQTSLSQLDNVNVELDIGDAPTSTGKVLAGDYMVSSWGFPALDPDPGLYNGTHSASRQNYAKYKNSDVDQWLNEGRVSNDDDVRTPLYQQVLVQLAEDIPFYPYVRTVNSFVSAPDVQGATMYNDAVLRYDLLWKSE